jgi:NADPH:quinone reductase-like Zn-dependent oxidoreductase
MVLGHEGAGTVVEVGAGVTALKPGDRVCMEPGIPDPSSRASKLGLYNVDPAVTFWATPPVHGILTSEVVHPAAFTYRLPPNVSFAEGAMVEPFAVGMHAAARARIAPGDTAVVIGAGTIGIMVALAALAGGCARVFVSDLSAEKLRVAGGFAGVVPVDATREDLGEVVMEATDGWGADVVFEASGSPAPGTGCCASVRPGGALVLVGLPPGPSPSTSTRPSPRSCAIETVFRYANVFDRASSSSRRAAWTSSRSSARPSPSRSRSRPSSARPRGGPATSSSRSGWTRTPDGLGGPSAGRPGRVSRVSSGWGQDRMASAASSAVSTNRNKSRSAREIVPDSASASQSMMLSQ